MIGAEVEMSEADKKQLMDAIKRASANFPNSAEKWVKKAALAVCRSMRARTKKAPKSIPQREYSARPSSTWPKYITKKDGTVLHRWDLTKKVGTPKEDTYRYFVYAHAKTNRRGMLVKDLAGEKRELLKFHGKIPRAGLAKLSWGWAMNKIVSGSDVNVRYHRRKGDKRNPVHAITADFRKVAINGERGAEVLIENALDYIRSAVSQSALSESISAASNAINAQIDKALLRARKF